MFQHLSDDRQRAHGWPLVLLAAVVGCAAVVSWLAVANASWSAATGWNLATALVWIGGAAGSVHNGRRMRYLAFSCWALNFVGIAMGAAGFSFATVNPWHGGGLSYYFVPSVLSVLAVVWLWWSAPANIAARQQRAG